METPTVGRVTVEATIENLEDLFAVKNGQKSPEEVRRLSIPNALVDTGATTLSLPTRMIQQLGLSKWSEKKVTTSSGQATTGVYDAVRLTIQGRECTVDVLEVPDNVPPLIGQIPLEFLDFVVDPTGGRLIGNPAHGGEHMFEMY
jgi:clan AA aspartic protease